MMLKLLKAVFEVVIGKLPEDKKQQLREDFLKLAAAITKAFAEGAVRRRSSLGTASRSGRGGSRRKAAAQVFRTNDGPLFAFEGSPVDFLQMGGLT